MRGFTLIELLVVIAIIGILSGLALHYIQEVEVTHQDYQTNQGK